MFMVAAPVREMISVREMIVTCERDAKTGKKSKAGSLNTLPHLVVKMELLNFYFRNRTLLLVL